MEYFHRLLHKMQKNPDFKHHHKCKELQLTNITFVDDVLMFVRDDTQSVRMLLQVIQDFSCSTGMVVNPRKCKVYIGGADANTCLRINDLTTFQEATLPFKYMGIPMSSKRLDIHQFCPLIDRITSRITHWSSRLLSYAGKVQLVKSVCFSTANYWLQCLSLPKNVIQHINPSGQNLFGYCVLKILNGFLKC
ncbi:uncharacterized protein LOC131597127 [Vicia villosa]|uniref:uncharacterized protein LOC131597127 n=1 Tax=Vicia villosa TaxID=3911 RepID=UPI00273ACD18|nr:uncharacterized protein LOC131597127 [Vicia villosa]